MHTGHLRNSAKWPNDILICSTDQRKTRVAKYYKLVVLLKNFVQWKCLWNNVCMMLILCLTVYFKFLSTCFCNATSDWITSKICDSISCNIQSEIVCVISYVTYPCMTCGFMQLAMLQFERKLQKCIRMGITIFIITFREVYRRIYGRKSRFTAPLVCHSKTKFPTVYQTIYLPKWKFWIQLSPKFGLILLIRSPNNITCSYVS